MLIIGDAISMGYTPEVRTLLGGKATNAKLIWCATTPVPEGDVKSGRKNSDVIARKTMDENGVAIDDLYTFALPQLKQIQLRANVHFSPAGSAVLAKQEVASIETALPKPTTP